MKDAGGRAEELLAGIWLGTESNRGATALSSSPTCSAGAFAAASSATSASPPWTRSAAPSPKAVGSRRGACRLLCRRGGGHLRDLSRLDAAADFLLDRGLGEEEVIEAQRADPRPAALGRAAFPRPQLRPSSRTGPENRGDLWTRTGRRSLVQLDRMWDLWRSCTTATSTIYGLMKTRSSCVSARRSWPRCGMRSSVTSSRAATPSSTSLGIVEESLWTNLYLVMEAMRGHLVGPGRRGLRVRGGRRTLVSTRAAAAMPPSGATTRSRTRRRAWNRRTDGESRQRHDFAWNTKGVCYYCSNCCVVMQLKPIDAFGYPVGSWNRRPIPASRTRTWHVYKDPTKVPERYYRAVGRQSSRPWCGLGESALSEGLVAIVTGAAGGPAPPCHVCSPSAVAES